VSNLAHKQLELAITEVKADLKRETAAAAGLSVATIFAFLALNLLFVTAALALASWMPAWAAGLIVAGLTLVIALAIGLTAWNKRVVDPLARTRRTIKEDVRWSKEKLA
jgi:apolipoprotein N-acyltransferase